MSAVVRSASCPARPRTHTAYSLIDSTASQSACVTQRMLPYATGSAPTLDRVGVMVQEKAGHEPPEWLGLHSRSFAPPLRAHPVQRLFDHDANAGEKPSVVCLLYARTLLGYKFLRRFVPMYGQSKEVFV